MFRDLPIKRKLIFISLLTSVIGLVLACGAFVVYEQFTFRQNLVRDLSILSRVVGYNSASALAFDDASSADQTLRSVVAARHILGACIYNKSGEVFATYRQAGARARPWPVVQPQAAVFHDDRLAMFHPIMQDDALLGTIYIEADLAPMHALLKRYVAIALVVLLVAACISLAITTRVQRIISGPVSELASIARLVAHDRNYAVRAVKRGNDELGHLIDGFNAMLAQIQTRDAALQQARDELEKRVADRTAELERAKEEAAGHAAQLRFVFEAIPIGVSWQRYDTNEYLANDVVFRISGLGREQLKSRESFADVTHPHDFQVQEELRAKLERRETDHIQLEKRYLRSNGEVVWAMLTSRVFRHPDGRIAQEVNTLVDITARKEAEQRLANSLSTLHATLESTPDGILVVDHKGRVTNYNRKFAELWRIPSELLARGDDAEILGFVLSQVADEDKFIGKIKELYAQPDAESFDLLDFKDGRVIERYSQAHRINGITGGRVWCFRDVTERKRAEEHLAATHKKLVDTSRLAGMAEVATGVLHNVGNVLNSVNVTATLLLDQVRTSKSANVAKLAALLHENSGSVGEFLTHDPRGQRIPRYLNTLAADLATERQTMDLELEHLRKHIEHIKEIVAMQQSYARVSGMSEVVPLVELVEDALRMNAGAFARHGLEVVRDFQVQPLVTVERHKVLQILVNLIRNAKYACDESGRTDKRLIVRIAQESEHVQVSVVDNGVGIPAENITRIFNHGFTTRRDGHGFGLHSGALAARELGGSLIARSEGVGRGATFVLEIPCALEPQLV